MNTENALKLADKAEIIQEVKNDPLTSKFELNQRTATLLSKSDLVPKQYQNNMPNCYIAANVASQIGCDVLMVMQNLHVIQGRPSWSSQFIIAALNSCGRFSPIKFKMSGSGDSLECTAYATELRTGETLEGVTVSMKMAKSEGWVSKTGSKWQTMPELMIRYRAAAFFGRLYAPEILNGLHSSDEIEDIAPPKNVTPVKQNQVDRIKEEIEKDVKKEEFELV